MLASSETKAPSKSHLPKIAVLATGGTLASLADVRTQEYYRAATVPIAEFMADLPELNAIAQVKHEQFAQVFSQDIGLDLWLNLARRVDQLLNTENCDGVVITHGTDTLEETAYFLNLIVKTKKPIVITGAMRPANALGADGIRNLYNAVLVAAHPDASNKGVLVTLNDGIHQARDVVKTQVHTVDSFKTSELGLLGYVQGDVVYFYRSPVKRHTWQTEFSLPELNNLPLVHIVYGYVGSDNIMVEAALNHGVKGFVSAGVGRGHQSPMITQSFRKARQQGVVIVRSSRVEHGIVTRNPDIDDVDDFVASNNLNPQKSRILLMLALLKTNNTKEIQQMFDIY